jgi:hypothetical protein
VRIYDGRSASVEQLRRSCLELEMNAPGAPFSLLKVIEAKLTVADDREFWLAM